MVSLSLEELLSFHLIVNQIFERLLKHLIAFLKSLNFLLLGRLSPLEFIDLVLVRLDLHHASLLIFKEILR